MQVQFRTCQPISDLQLCKGCGARFDRIISSMPCHVDRPDGLHLQSVVEFVSAAGLQRETIVYKLFKKLGVQTLSLCL